MLIILKKDATKEQVQYIKNEIINSGLKPLYMPGTEKIVFGIIGDVRKLEKLNLNSLTFVDEIIRVLKPYKLASRSFKPIDTIVKVKGIKFGEKKVQIIAGPCAVESYEQVKLTADGVKKAGASVLRGGAFKPRSSPYAFQGLGEKGLEILHEVGREVNMPVVTEILRVEHIKMISKYTDILQIGARNMQNFELLKAVGKTKIPVLLKRGMSATIEEFLMAAEYILSEGNSNVILCERGIRTFENYTRNTLDLSAVALLKEITHLPVIVDPSHSTGKRSLVAPMSKAAIAAGADGLIIEVHYSPDTAQVDGKQSLSLEQFTKLSNGIKAVAEAVERSV